MSRSDIIWIQNELRKTLKNIMKYDINYVINNIDNLMLVHYPNKPHIIKDNIFDFLDTKNNQKKQKTKIVENYNLENVSLFSKIKEIYPEFLENIKNDIDEEEYSFYIKNIFELSREVNCLSIIKAGIAYDNVQAYIIKYNELEKKFKEKIEFIIGDLDVNRLIKIQAKYMVIELYKYIDLAIEKLYDLSLSDEEKESIRKTINKVHIKIAEYNALYEYTDLKDDMHSREKSV